MLQSISGPIFPGLFVYRVSASRPIYMFFVCTWSPVWMQSRICTLVSGSLGTENDSHTVAVHQRGWSEDDIGPQTGRRKWYSEDLCRVCAINYRAICMLIILYFITPLYKLMCKTLIALSDYQSKSKSPVRGP